MSAYAVFLVLITVGAAQLAAPAMAQERGEVPSLAEQNAVRDLRRDNAVEPGFGVEDQARTRTIRSLNRNEAHRDARGEISASTFGRLRKDQDARQQTRALRSFNPGARRDDRRRARTDRRLRARINEALRQK